MTELQNDRQDKNNMPPDLRSRGHKNISSHEFSTKVSQNVHSRKRLFPFTPGVIYSVEKLKTRRNCAQFNYNNIYT